MTDIAQPKKMDLEKFHQPQRTIAQQNRVSQMEVVECALISCRKEVSDCDNAGSCKKKIHHWLHQACAGFTQTEYTNKERDKITLEILVWFCNACRPTPHIHCFLQGKPQMQSPRTTPATTG